MRRLAAPEGFPDGFGLDPSPMQQAIASPGRSESRSHASRERQAERPIAHLNCEPHYLLASCGANDVTRPTPPAYRLSGTERGCDLPLSEAVVENFLPCGGFKRIHLAKEPHIPDGQGFLIGHLKGCGQHVLRSKRGVRRNGHLGPEHHHRGEDADDSGHHGDYTP